MESHHLVKSPILLGARKPLRRYLSTDTRRGGARLLEEEETCAICSPILFVHSRIIRLFFAKISLASLCSILPFRKILYLYVFFICNLLFVFCYLFICYHFLFMFLLAIFITSLSWCQYSWPTLAGPASPPSLLTPLPLW